MINHGFSLRYNGDTLRGADRLETADGLKITCAVKEYPKYGAKEWVLNLTHTGVSDSGLIEDLFDCDTLLPLPEDPPRFRGNHLTDNCASVFSQCGMVPGWSYITDDALSATEFRLRRHYLRYGEEKQYTNGSFGRSSDGQLPFFDVNAGGEGYIVAIGWTGGWRAAFTREEAGMRVRAGLRHIALKLHPGESIRAVSVLIMRYDKGQTEARNRFRRLIRDVFAPFGKGKRPAFAPLAFESWGGLPSDTMKEHLSALKAHGAQFDHHWIDAGWQGDSKQPCPSNSTGDWYLHTGEFFVNRNYHPMGLQDVVQVGEAAGMRLMMWFEPERMLARAPAHIGHPEWFLEWPGADRQDEKRNVLLNLGNEEAWQYCFDTICSFIDELHIACYRQDFNCDPAPCWQANDEPERAGMLEIGHITGLYRLWDALLARYPELIIDDCSGGGRRIDAETLRRSVPFCRSDFYCGFNANPDVLQSHTSGASLYFPYTGCWTKVKADLYAARSAYAPSTGYSCWCTDFQSMNDEELDMLAGFTAEYRAIRRYLTEDFYPLSAPELDDAAWTAWQYHAPGEDAGVVIVFRRPASPMERARFALNGLDPDAAYRVTCLDDGSVQRLRGDVLAGDGLPVAIARHRDSRVIRYEKEG